MTRLLLLSSLMLGWASSAAAQTYACDTTMQGTNCQAAIPDATKVGTGSVTSTLVVGKGDCPVEEVNGVSLSLQILHQWAGDLSVTLTAPDGKTTATVFAQPGPSVTTDKSGCPREDVSATFSDSADGGIGCSFPTAVTGNLVPAMPFSTFNGTPRAGTWTLKVTDNGKEMVGALTGWSLTLPCTAPTDGGTPSKFEVYIEAATPTANISAGTPGVFRVTREGETKGDLVVSYTLSGTAPRAAYEELPGTVTIPDGASSATFQVKPVSTSTPAANEGTVVATLAPGAYELRDYISAYVTLESGLPGQVVAAAKSGCGCQSGSPVNSALPLMLGLALLRLRRTTRRRT